MTTQTKQEKDEARKRHPSYPQGDKPIPPRLTDSEQLRKDLEIRHIHWQAMDIGGIKISIQHFEWVRDHVTGEEKTAAQAEIDIYTNDIIKAKENLADLYANVQYATDFEVKEIQDLYISYF